MAKGPNCYDCQHRRELPGNAHSRCVANVTVKGVAHGIKNGWFFHPFNFDPVWLEECSGFESKKSNVVSGAVGEAA